MSNPSNSSPGPLSPIHQVANRLQSSKRANVRSCSNTSLAKRSKLDLGEESGSSLRREVLVKQAMAIPEIQVLKAVDNNVKQTMATPGIKILKAGDEVECNLNVSRVNNCIKSNSSKEVLEIRDEAEILVVPDSSVELEELLQDSMPRPVEGEGGEEAKIILGKSPSKSNLLEVKSCKTKKKKKEEAQVRWRDVRRSKRRTKYFSFCESYEGTIEVVTLDEVESRKVPKVLGGRRPLTLVPGLDYGLGEGEGMVLTEEEEREVRLANQENYALNSFVCDAGHLSDDEMVETPMPGRVRRVVKQRRQQKVAKDKQTLPLRGGPEVSGCLWSSFTQSGWRHCKQMKRWEAVVLAPPPISMSVGVLLLPGDLKLMNAHLMTTTSDSTGCCTSLTGESLDSCHTSLSREPAVSRNTSEWEKKYRVKYKVKQLMEGLMEGPVGCSTPRPGTIGSLVAVIGQPCDLDALTKRVMVDWSQKVEDEEKKLVHRYVCKYFFKLKRKGKF